MSIKSKSRIVKEVNFNNNNYECNESLSESENEDASISSASVSSTNINTNTNSHKSKGTKDSHDDSESLDEDDDEENSRFSLRKCCLIGWLIVFGIIFLSLAVSFLIIKLLQTEEEEEFPKVETSDPLPKINSDDPLICFCLMNGRKEMDRCGKQAEGKMDMMYCPRGDFCYTRTIIDTSKSSNPNVTKVSERGCRVKPAGVDQSRQCKLRKKNKLHISDCYCAQNYCNYAEFCTCPT